MSRHHQNTRAIQAQHKRILRASDVCHICGRPGADTVDHLVPVARGGSEDDSNKKPAHSTCNRAKSDKAYAPIVRRSGSLT